MFDVRTFNVGRGGWVVSARGDLDGSGAAEIAAAVGRCDEAVVVDLLAARFVDLDILDAFVDAVGPDVTFVAERTMLQALLVVGLHRHVAVESTLAAALT
jgi:anti-anti-sigma regulatory factor